MSLPDLAVQIVSKTISELTEETARTIIMVGSKSAGKTNLLHSFLEKTDKPRETLILEYSFGRKSSQKQGIEKSICHVWEYGGKLEMLKSVLLSIPVRGKFFYCVMVDLSRVTTIWNTLETCIQGLKESYTDLSPEMLLIGAKYDVFKNYDSEMKKNVCSTLRSVALLQNAHLLFYSQKEAQLVKKSKEVFYNMGFGNGIPLREKNTNYTKPLMIPKSTDNWESIGVPVSTLEQKVYCNPTKIVSDESMQCGGHKIKLRHLSRIPSEAEITREIKGLQRSHPEPILDSLVTHKYVELHTLETFDPLIDDCLTY